jgi:hypothetical protein
MKCEDAVQALGYPRRQPESAARSRIWIDGLFWYDFSLVDFSTRESGLNFDQNLDPERNRLNSPRNSYTSNFVLKNVAKC